MMIRIGSDLDPALPPHVLVEAERAELAKLLELRAELQGQLSTLEGRVQLLLLNARDRRGLAGRISVDLNNGSITKEEGSHG